jgi:hypothetical protein
MRFADIPNYLSNSVAAAGKFGEEFSNYVGQGLNLGRGATGPRAVYGGMKEAVKYARQGNLPLAAATGTLDVLTDASRGTYWFLNHALAVSRNVGRGAAEKMGLDPITTDLLGRSTPFAVAALGGAVGNPLQGARPAGFKSILPVSKEEDPTGRTSANPAAESVLRYFTGRRGDPLPYQTFKEERPEVAYPTYQEYLRYKQMKPDGLGKIDPKTQSFVGPLGIIRGTAKGLNEPEIQYFGFPITASTAIGAATALGTTGALQKALPDKMRYAQTVMARTPEMEQAVKQIGRELAVEKAGIPIGKGTQGGVKYLSELLQDVSQKEAIGAPKLPVAAGIVAAGLGAGYLAKKASQAVFNKQAEGRLKKEQPVEYLKHKYGSFQSASEALGNPQVKSWQELTPYMNS